MKVKLDENLPRALAALLRAARYEVSTVTEEGLAGAADASVLQAAASEGRVLLTFDRDFADIRRYSPGAHAGIVVFRLDDQRWESLQAPARRLIASRLLERLRQGTAIVDERRVRIRPGTAGATD